MKAGYVYAIESGDAVKIGWAGAPLRRLSELNVGSPGRHRLIGFVSATRSQEAELHQLLTPARVRGEWFSKSRAVCHFLDMLPKYAPPLAMARTDKDTVRAIISLWPSADVFSDDLGLRWRSHGRVMKVRGAIPVSYWPRLLAAADRRGISLSGDDLIAAHAKKASAAE